MPHFLQRQKEEEEPINYLADMIKSLAHMGDTLDKLYALTKEQKEGKKEELVMLQTYAQTYYAQGYQNNSFYIPDSAVADTAKIIVSLGGLSYTITLAAGENALNLPDGATYKVTTTSSNPVSALLIRYNDTK